MLEVQRTNSNSFSPTNSQPGPSAPLTLSVPQHSLAHSHSKSRSNTHLHSQNRVHSATGLPPIMASSQPFNNNNNPNFHNKNNNHVSLTYASLDNGSGTNPGMIPAPNNHINGNAGANVSSSISFPQQPQQPQHQALFNNSLFGHSSAPAPASSTLPPPTRESVLQRLSEALLRRSLAKIDLSQKGLSAQDARLVKMALLQNRQLRVLKLGYNQLGDAGIEILVAGLSQHAHLQSLDLGFNNIGDAGCQSLAQAIGAPDSMSILSTLYLAGNCIRQEGAMALADVIRGRDTSSCTTTTTSSRRRSTLQRLYLTGNRLGPEGVKAITEAILEDAALNRNNNDNNESDSLMGATILVDGDATSALTSTADNDAMETTPEEGSAVPTHGSSLPPQQLQQSKMTTIMETSAATAATANSTLASSSLQSCPTSPSSAHGKHSSTSAPASPTTTTSTTSSQSGMRELFLGGTALGAAGCQAVARLLASPDCKLKVLSLANCDITDEEITQSDLGLAPCIKRNRDGLVLSSLQLSFNALTHKGLEALMNALWGSKTLKELRLDNNDIGDRGAQQLAAILPYLKTLESLDVGFNNINNKNQGMKILMKAVAETNNLTTLSLSGNPMQDVSSAKAVAYALAYNCSLQSLLLVHCHLTTEGQRHVAAGAVSNSRTSLRELSGFPVGPVIVTLGFPDALEHWTNEQVLNFIHLMWNKTKLDNENGIEEEEEKGLDPLNFLPGSSVAEKNKAARRSGPLEATIVVDVARKAFASLVANGVDVFSRRPGHPNSMSSPAVFAPRDAIMLESVDGDSIVESMGEIAVSSSPPSSSNNLGVSNSNGSSPPRPPIPMSSAKKSSTHARSFVAPPQERNAAKQSQLPDPSRKKRIVEWLCSNIKHLNKLSQMPFDSGELLKLHQHYFTPVVNESGGTSAFKHDGAIATSSVSSRQASSVPNVSRDSSNNHHFEDTSSPSLSSTATFQSTDVSMVPASDPMFTMGGQQLHSQQCPQQRSGYPQAAASSLPMLKRKVSYRFLGDASMHQQNNLAPPSQQHSTSSWGSAFGGGSNLGSVAKMIQDGPSGHTLPPKNKKARRNRTRISFLPRIKAKLDSYLDVCHEKALITMRQLYYVEQAILNGRVNPLDADSPRTHLSGALAADAETIVVDMI